MRSFLLCLSSFILAVGFCGGPLLMRLYFLHGGSLIWFSSWLQTAGFPLIFIPLLVSYHRRRRGGIGSDTAKFFQITPFLSVCAALIGVLIGVDNYLYSYGVAKLPVSTSSIIIATQLAFTAGFAFLFVKQRFTAFSMNAVVLLTLGSVVLGVHAGKDRPAGETVKGYVMGFVLTVAAAAVYGLILPLVELSYMKAKQSASFDLVLEFQLIMGFMATLFATIGMLANKDFEAIGREGREYGLGTGKFYALIVTSSITWQLNFIGVLGVISYGSSLLSGVLITVLLPVTEVLAIVFYHEKFQAEKGISLFLSLWGFLSYSYGEMKHSSAAKSPPVVAATAHSSSSEMNQMMTPPSATAEVPSRPSV